MVFSNRKHLVWFVSSGSPDKLRIGGVPERSCDCGSDVSSDDGDEVEVRRLVQASDSIKTDEQDSAPWDPVDHGLLTRTARYRQRRAMARNGSGLIRGPARRGVPGQRHKIATARMHGTYSASALPRLPAAQNNAAVTYNLSSLGADRHVRNPRSRPAASMDRPVRTGGWRRTCDEPKAASYSSLAIMA